MAKGKTEVEIRNFAKGIITEVSPLNGQPDSAKDMQNLVLQQDGTIQRRAGLNIEANADLLSAHTKTDDAELPYQSFPWQTSYGAFVVVQAGNTILVYDAEADNSTNSILFADVSEAYADSLINGVGFGDDFVFVYQKSRTVNIITATSPTTFSMTGRNLFIRDLFGVDDDLEDNERPTTLTNNHRYNLYNQGWPDEDVRMIIEEATIEVVDSTQVVIDPMTGLPDGTKKIIKTVPVENFDGEYDALAQTKSIVGFYPSNADVFSELKTINENTKGTRGYYNPKELLNEKPKAPAAKGAILIKFLDMFLSRRERSGVNIDTVDVFAGGPTVVTKHAGRLFYGGFVGTESNENSTTPTRSKMILFSQSSLSKDSYGKCYSLNSPTSPTFNEVTAADGGFINIPEVETILALEPIGNSLVVVATNGVWAIRSPDTGFSPTTYVIDKISDIGASSKKSIVNADQSIVYWSAGGIYSVAYNAQTLRLEPRNLTEQTYQKAYKAIPTSGINGAEGFYDKADRYIRFLYSDDQPALTYNSELYLNTITGAFTRFKISKTDASSVRGYFRSPVTSTRLGEDQVVVGGELVVAGADEVFVSQRVISTEQTAEKLITLCNNGVGNFALTFSQYIDGNFVDFASVPEFDGEDIEAFVIVQDFTASDASKRKQVPYFTTYFERTEDGYDEEDLFNLTGQSSCLVQSRWDFSGSAASGKWGREFQAYRLRRAYLPEDSLDDFDYGYDVVVTKNKLRGRGRALSLRMRSEPGKNMHILGWGMAITGNTTV